MAKITKLGQTFVAGTEATAASLNAQNAKIDQIIENFTLNDDTVALPITKSETAYKITSIGTGLSVSNNTLNVTLPAATTSSLGGVKIPTGKGISNNSGSIGVDIDDSTIKLNSSGKLYATVSGGVSESAMTTAIQTAINRLDASDTDVSGKYVSKVTLTDGIISVTRADLPSLISSNLMYFSKAAEGDYSIANALVQVVDFIDNVATIDVTSSHKTLGLLLPTDKDSFTFKDSHSQNVTGDLIFAGVIVRSGKLYNLFYKTGGGYLTGTYTLTKND